MPLPERPRPRAVVLGLSQEGPFAEAILATLPTVEFAENYWDVRLEDFDVVVVRGDKLGERFPGGPKVLWFSDEGTVAVRTDNPAHVSTWASWKDGEKAAEFERGDSALSPAIGELADTVAPQSNNYRVLFTQNSAVGEDVRAGCLLREKGGKQNVVASVVHQSGHVNREAWLLPDRAFDRAGDWLRAALAHWKALDPDTFPAMDWASAADWMDASQRKLFNELTAHDQETAATLRSLNEKRQTLTREMERVTANAKTGLLRLLTSQGEELVRAVTSALELFGFTVSNSDQARPGEKFEDLLVADDDWDAVAEVKGYSKRNAKSNDLYQVQRAVTAYVQRECRLPAASWYVINQSYDTPPSLRPRPLHTNAETVAMFAADKGLIIDTRDLFHLTVAVQEGKLDPATARDVLKTATGVLDDPAATIDSKNIQ